MTTNYKQIYNTLNKNGVIDKLINKYSEFENTMLVKSDIIYGIELAVDFFNSTSFKEMKYWSDKTKEIKYQIAREIEKEYAILKIEEAKNDIAMFEYLVNTIK